MQRSTDDDVVCTVAVKVAGRGDAQTEGIVWFAASEVEPGLERQAVVDADEAGRCNFRTNGGVADHAVVDIVAIKIVPDWHDELGLSVRGRQCRETGD
ncbi:MAG TPA: hypothetical protein VG797_06685 [Phycisphaerales bacterium]|nr:hypothetical protein [Phycisphaerales bacterium]